MSKSLMLAALAAVVTSLPAGAAGPDFEPEVLQRVLGGEVVVENLVTSNREFKLRFRAYFAKGTPAKFVNVVTDHAAFPTWIPEAKSAETTARDEDGLGWKYKAEIFIDMGIVNQTVYPEGHQRVTWPATAGGDTEIRNQITNYADQLQSGEERTRLIPYEAGFLVDTTIEGVGRQDLAAFIATLVRRELRARGKKLIERTRDRVAALN